MLKIGFLCLLLCTYPLLNWPFRENLLEMAGMNASSMVRGSITRGSLGAPTPSSSPAAVHVLLALLTLQRPLQFLTPFCLYCFQGNVTFCLISAGLLAAVYAVAMVRPCLCMHTETAASCVC